METFLKNSFFPILIDDIFCAANEIEKRFPPKDINDVTCLLASLNLLNAAVKTPVGRSITTYDYLLCVYENKKKNTSDFYDSIVTNDLDYSIYKDWPTVRKTFPSEYDVSYLQIREMIFQLSHLTDYYSIKEKVSQLRRRLNKSKDKSLIEEALNVLDYKCDELSINIDTLFN